jgi:GNAT superfamily N-acetyltransferase
MDLEALFGPSGACSGCWCMWWRIKRSEFACSAGEQKRLAFKVIVESGEEPGLLAYNQGSPVGWVSVAPRKVYGSLERSRLFKPLENTNTWSVVCFFIHKDHRRKGLTCFLLKEAIRFAAQHGAQVVEGYPVIPRSDRAEDAYLFTGIVTTFLEAGFTEVDRPSERRVLMRHFIKRNKEIR